MMFALATSSTSCGRLREGSNPVWGGKAWKAFDAKLSSGVDRLAFRVLWEKPIAPALTAHNGALLPDVTVRGDVREYRWSKDDVDPFDPEPDLPPDAVGWPWVELSEWQSWNEVARWADGMFDTKPKSALFDAEVAQLKGLATAEERVREAVRFVQDDLRYLALEDGMSSHHPHDAQWVLERRFGDCKDKALLTASLLRALGVEANAALVSTQKGTYLDTLLPSPYHFNHAIVVAQIDGKPVWIDATISMQRGALARRLPPPYHRALVISPRHRGARGDSARRADGPGRGHRVPLASADLGGRGDPDRDVEVDGWGGRQRAQASVVDGQRRSDACLRAESRAR